MSCDLPVPRMARTLKMVFHLANALVDVVSSELQLVHFGGEPDPEGRRQQVPARGFDEQGSKNRIFPTRKPPGVLSAPLSVSSSFRGKPTSRLARALSLRPVGWEEGPGKSSAAVAMQGGETSALLEVSATTTATYDYDYESLGRGFCACRNPTRKNGLALDLCNSDVPLQGFSPHANPRQDFCRTLCSDAAESLCLERNRHEAALLRGSTNETDSKSALRGCAGFMSFTPLISAHGTHVHPRANHVLFFSGYQTVTGIAASQEQYKQKGGKFVSLASSYLQPVLYQSPNTILDVGDEWRVVRSRADYLPRCVYYVGDNHGRPAGPGSLGAGQTPRMEVSGNLGQAERMEVSGNLGQAERLEVLFNVAVGGVAVFSIALLVVAAFLVVACCKHQKTKRASEAGRKVVRSSKTTHDGQPPTPPVLASTVVPEEPPPGTNEERKHRAAVVDVAPHAVTLAAEYPIYVRDQQPTLKRRKDDFRDRGKSPRQPSIGPPTDTATPDHDPSHIPPEIPIRGVGVGREEHSPSLLGQYEARMVLAVLEDSDLGATESRGAGPSPPPNSEATSTEAP